MFAGIKIVSRNQKRFVDPLLLASSESKGISGNFGIWTFPHMGNINKTAGGENSGGKGKEMSIL